MQSVFVEAAQRLDGQGGCNWGKFMVGRFEEHEWNVRSVVGLSPLLRSRGWTPDHVLVLDLETGEGAILRHGGSAHHDLEKHKVWVCPLFEPFLEWLYKQNLEDLTALPPFIEIPNAEFLMSGHRRPGPRPG